MTAAVAPNRQTRRAQAAKASASPANAARGEKGITVAGRTYRLALTMSAMAEIEDHFGVDNLQEATKALEQGGSKDFAAFVAALCRGGGEEITMDDVRRWPITMPEVGAAIKAALDLAGLEEEAPGK